MNEKIMKAAGFEKEVKEVKEGICPFCKKKVDEKDFVDFISKREFEISGLCQACQDKMFS